VYDAIHYTKVNPLGAKPVSSPEGWKWASAWVSTNQPEKVSDTFSLPVKLLDPQKIKGIITGNEDLVPRDF
jgi:hypothetical protein